MSKKRIGVFFGTRPEAIKMAPVVKALRSCESFESIVIATGQHKEMLDQVVELFRIKVDTRFNVMRENQGLAGLTARLLEETDAFLAKEKLDFALVQGDTTTVLAVTLACFYRGIPVGHVEAGLRTGDLMAPFPEEANRVLAGRLMALHFPPTKIGEGHLRTEGVDPSKILVTGNTVIDALQLEVERQSQSSVESELRKDLAAFLPESVWKKPFVLITGHRRENFGGGFEQICEAISKLAAQYPDLGFVYPVHLNPNVHGPVQAKLSGASNVFLLPPQQYSHFIALMRASYLILTDSGGVQEEAPSLGKPVLVMRETTERPEGITAGTVKLVGASAENIVREVSRLLDSESEYQAMAMAVNPYGDGQAAQRMVSALQKYFG